MFRENWRLIKVTFGDGRPLLLNEYSMFFALSVGVVALYVHTFLTVGLSPVEMACGVLFVGMLIPSIWREIRVFAPVMLALIPMALRGAG